MVEQFGFAIILSSGVNVLALISGATSFLVGSIRQADELSTTVIPASANFGASASDVLPPAEKIATAGLAAMASSKLTTVYGLPLNSTCLPTDRSEATLMSSDTGKLRSSRTFRISPPTRPVAPTTAIFIMIYSDFCEIDRKGTVKR